MLIGEFSKRVGLSPSTIRYYEKEGLLRSAVRQSGRRVFDAEDVLAAQMLVQARALGFSISELREVTRARGTSGSAKGDIKDALSKKLGRIDGEINRLEAMRGRLVSMLACDCSKLSACRHVGE